MIDSFPIPVCKFGRARFCSSFLADGANYGKCPSKKETYYGFKVYALITLEGYITAYEITPASIDGREGLRDFAENYLNLVISDPRGQGLYRGAAFRRYALKRYMPYVVEAFQLQNKLVKGGQAVDFPFPV